MKKRIFSLLLALMMMAGMLSVTALAEESAVSLEAASGDDDFYPGSTVTVQVRLSKSGYAGLILKTTCGGLEQKDLEVAEELGGFAVNSAGNTIWVNCNLDENGDLVLNEGEDPVVNTTYTGLIANLTYTIPADAKAGDTFTVSATVDAVAADETVVLDAATGSTTITVVERPYVLGDVYVDGVPCDILDIQKACMVFMGLESFECPPEAADVFPDGEFDILDIQKLCMVFMGLETL